MHAQPTQRRALRLLEDEIARLESETLPQLTAAPEPLCAHWQAYAAHARLLPAKLRLQQLYERRRRLWGEPVGLDRSGASPGAPGAPYSACPAPGPN